MAAEFVGEASLSGDIQLLLERIASPETLNYFHGNEDSESEAILSKLKIAASSLAAVLGDAERRQIRDDPKVKAWLAELQQAVFDADDLLDRIEPDVLRRKVREPKNENTLKKLFLVLLCWRFQRSSNGETRNEIERILNRFKQSVKQKNLLSLKGNLVEHKPWKSSALTSLVKESEVFGRETDKESLMKLSLSDDSGGDKICVIPIVGVAGIGKTTLAQAIFDDEQVREHFRVKAWVCVSEECDPLRVTKEILELVSEHGFFDDSMDLNSVQVELRKSLAGKKFLIVLDDIRNESHLDWDSLRLSLNDGAQGSKIIVTTRSKKVGDVMGTVESHQLVRLAEEECWRLFARHALCIVDFTKNPDLERIGREIVGKCKGLPLAVKMVGGLLRSTSDVREWQRVSKSDLWELTQREILPALRLSYHYLPSPLKRCFAYCSIFSKKYRFRKEDLILLWMAENLLQDPMGDKKMEDVGDEYFRELVFRSFLQQRTISGRSFFVVHDLLVDLARFVSTNCFLIEASGSVEAITMMQARRLGYISDKRNRYERFEHVLGATHLRTFLTLRRFGRTLPNDALDNLFLKLRRLRVLSLSNYRNIRKLPDSLGDLRHLRYINLSLTSITCLPRTLVTLYNLQTLKLVHCHSLEELPKDFHNLINLRHLDISHSNIKELPKDFHLLISLRYLDIYRSCIKELPKDFHRLINLRYLNVSSTSVEELPASLSSLSSLHSLILPDYLKEMPKHISKLKNLDRLSTFMVEKEVGTRIGELGELQNLRGKLCITNLQNVVNAKDASEAKLKEKKYLEELIFEWERKEDSDVNNAPMHEKHVFENLVPNPSLKKLEIDGYGGKEFPNWLGNESLCNIVNLYLSSCRHCVTLPPLGQLSSLKTLVIKRFDAVANVGPEFYGNRSSTIKPFASLEELEFDWMESWKEWSTPDGYVEAFPKLRKLSLNNCYQLTSHLPRFLPSLTELWISNCYHFASLLPKMPELATLSLVNCSMYMISLKEALESFSCLRHLAMTGKSFSVQFTASLEPRRSLRLEHFRNLESFWVSSNGQLVEGLKSLSTLFVKDCPDVTLFPRNMPAFSRLTFLELQNLHKLKFLPEEMDKLLQALESLHIYSCPELETFPISGLPSTLTSLYIEKSDKLVASRGTWNLQRLTNLTSFGIYGSECEDMVSFPEEDLLPDTVTELSIHYIKCLESLNGKGLQHLKSLTKLTITGCKNFRALPEEDLPSSLETLRIYS